jgi:adenylate cyclase
MAFWGAPLPDKRHAANAVEAGLAMIKAIERLNERFAARGRPPIKIGVGINTGLMNVGNMGSDFRMAYTVMGDAVNLGSRLEGLTKGYGTYIIVSESTRQAVPEYLYLELDRVRVKGKLEPVTIYQPVALLAEASDELKAQVAMVAEGLLAYRARDWARARGIFGAAAESGSFEFLAKLYIKRVDSLNKSPPGQDWDGVFVHEVK